jgi:hypothetical protein
VAWGIDVTVYGDDGVGYRFMAGTGLKVSVACLGRMTCGAEGATIVVADIKNRSARRRSV